MTPEIASSKSKTPRSIQKLPELLINQIAAGEVVERPASIIKELVENSLDADATQIEISLKSGGMEEIKVMDNGWGIDASEISLAFERHATSKIQTQEDLEGIHTFGFRGEALSSISSVSEVTLVTRRANVDYASEICISNGSILSPLKKTSSRVGTSITVHALFGKVPARQKFLRTPATELSHCIRALKEIALGNPQCIFSLSHHDRTLVQYTQSSTIERFKEVLRPDWEPEYFSESAQGMHYEMYLSPISETANKGELFLFINQRCIRNRILLQAVKQAYQETFGPGFEPSGCVYITLRADWVDPNVHPQKHEVRFLKQEVLFQWLLSSLRKKLSPFKVKLEANLLPDSTQTIAHSFQTLSTKMEFKVALKEDLLLFEDEKGLLITSKLCLQELLIKELWKNPKRESRALPVPALLPLTDSMLTHFLSAKDKLPAYGFELDLFGEQELAVKSTPSFFSEIHLDLFFKELLKESFTEQRLLRSLALYSTDLIPTAALPDLDSSTQTSDGRPVFFRVLYDDLKRYF